MEFGYTKQDEMYQLHSEGKILFKTAVIGIVISTDRDRYTLMKHGLPEHAKAWYIKASQGFREFGLDQLADELFYFETFDLPIEEINKMIHHSGYIPSQLEVLINDQTNSLVKAP